MWLTCELHSKWTPGTLMDVTYIVTARNKNTVPARAQCLRIRTILCLWKISTIIQIRPKVSAHSSHSSKAQEIRGTLSSTTSGSGGYVFISGTRSWAKVMTNDVMNNTTIIYTTLMIVLVNSEILLSLSFLFPLALISFSISSSMLSSESVKESILLYCLPVSGVSPLMLQGVLPQWVVFFILL